MKREGALALTQLTMGYLILYHIARVVYKSLSAAIL